MGWTIFTIVDLYVGLVLIDLMATTAPAEKLPRVRAARKITLGLLAVSVIALAVQLVHRHFAGGH